MTDEKDPIDPTSTEGDPEKFERNKQKTPTSTWGRIKRTLTPGTSPKERAEADQELEEDEEVDQERRSAIAKTGAAAGLLGLGVGAGGATIYQQQTAEEPAAVGPGVTPDEEEIDGDMDRIEAYMQTAERSEIPGPVEGEGYRVDEGLLKAYSETAWEDMANESEYEDLGTGAEWYLQEDGSVVGVNERQRVSRSFGSEEFEYNQDFSQLYQDLEDME